MLPQGDDPDDRLGALSDEEFCVVVLRAAEVGKEAWVWRTLAIEGARRLARETMP